MAESQMKTLLLDHTAGVLTITLNRPEVRNAMSLDMVGELTDVLGGAEADPTVRVVVVRGNGGHFCAGGDIGDMAQARMKMAAGDKDAMAVVNAKFGRLCLAYARSPLPIVTVLEGSVMGGGFGLACVSDVTLALNNVVFRLPETSLGVVPAQIAPFLVERIGYAEAKRLAVTGGKVEASEALAIRLVHEVHADAESLNAAVKQVATRMMACAPGAIATTKKLLARARLEEPQDLIEDAAQLFSQAIQSAEGQEGTAAFMQKRQPSWVPQES
ncbi:enoyl-CoA hydratase/isomerase family protein [Aquabacterium sp.]|uniref:enoyl-CoA hydratase/isomerase family protein n=1 Tax=Aquabacterium sp. TaxID=1872578 RepID=UPI002E33AC16|nr:enoyl-CoA hydratase-related protein [Aquabacterium sp.]HEX5310941.1 enoyl-CoA hydratase-related protein [Aquabacterium sp.]